MSISELKLRVIEKVTSFEDEETLKNILEQLEKKESKKDIKVHNLSQHFQSIADRYDDTLKKLAK